MKVTKEEKQRLVEEAQAKREAADKAHEAAAAEGADDATKDAADVAEEAATKAQADADAAEVEGEQPAEEVPVPEGEEEVHKDIDFEEELRALEGGDPAPIRETPPKKELTELEKAEKALHFNAERVKKLGGDPSKIVPNLVPPPTPSMEDEKPVTHADLYKRDVATEFRKVCRTEAEFKVLMWHLEHSIRSSGDALTDAQNAYFIAHKGKITRSFDEIRRAGFSRPMPGAHPGRKAPITAKVPTMSAADQNVLKRRGFVQKADGSWEGRKYIMRYSAEKKTWISEKKK